MSTETFTVHARWTIKNLRRRWSTLLTDLRAIVARVLHVGEAAIVACWVEVVRFAYGRRRLAVLVVRVVYDGAT